MQHSLPVRGLYYRQTARQFDHRIDQLDGRLQIVAFPTGWNLSVVRGEEIGTQSDFPAMASTLEIHGKTNRGDQLVFRHPKNSG
jgi:hypothetical protein